MPHRRFQLSVLGVLCIGAGCAELNPNRRIYFLDGAGHFGAGQSVKSGMRAAGYDGEFKEHVWTSGLLWGADHFIAARSEAKAEKLAAKLTSFRRSRPDGYLAVMSLSAGSSVLLNALEMLPRDVRVDDVVLFQPSVSSSRNLAPALKHVRRRMYFTSSRADAILASLAATADGNPLPAAGRDGFQDPPRLTSTQREQYTKLLDLPWRSRYSSLGWGGGHVASTHARFVEHVIAPRLLRSWESDVQRVHVPSRHEPASTAVHVGSQSTGRDAAASSM